MGWSNYYWSSNEDGECEWWKFSQKPIVLCYRSFPSNLILSEEGCKQKRLNAKVLKYEIIQENIISAELSINYLQQKSTAFS